jgi:hypothetical protein
MKGAGFFLGGLLPETLAFRAALWAMAAALALILAGALLSLPPLFGAAKASRSARGLFAKSPAINRLAAARIFGARDVWFVVGLPVFLSASGRSFTMVGALLALWIIGYGVIPAAAPGLVRRSAGGLRREVPAARASSSALTLVPLGLAALLLAGAPRPDLCIPVGLCAFGVLFAVNSSLHSHPVPASAVGGKAAEDVGFSCAANAAGRFLGTAPSGLLAARGGILALPARITPPASR